MKTTAPAITNISLQCVTTWTDDLGPRGKRLGTESAAVSAVCTVECADGVVYTFVRCVSTNRMASIALTVHERTHTISVGSLPVEVAVVFTRFQRSNAFLRSRFARHSTLPAPRRVAA